MGPGRHPPIRMAWLRRLFAGFAALAAVPAAMKPDRAGPAWPAPRDDAPLASEACEIEARSHAREIDALVRAQPVCVASTIWSAGKLADTVLYRWRRDGARLRVGYWVQWS